MDCFSLNDWRQNITGRAHQPVLLASPTPGVPRQSRFPQMLPCPKHNQLNSFSDMKRQRGSGAFSSEEPHIWAACRDVQASEISEQCEDSAEILGRGATNVKFRAVCLGGSSCHSCSLRSAIQAWGYIRRTGPETEIGQKSQQPWLKGVLLVLDMSETRRSVSFVIQASIVCLGAWTAQKD